MPEILKTSYEWAQIYASDFEILDPDGWQDCKFHVDKITEDEFMRRAMKSTCNFKYKEINAKDQQKGF